MPGDARQSRGETHSIAPAQGSGVALGSWGDTKGHIGGYKVSAALVIGLKVFAPRVIPVFVLGEFSPWLKPTLIL